MRRGLWIGAGLIACALAAVPLWLLLDDGDERRTAALSSTPAAVGTAGTLKLAGVKDSMAIESFAVDIKRESESGPAVDRIEIVRMVDISSPALLNMLTGKKAATGSIEWLRSGQLAARLNMTNVAVVDYAQHDAESDEPGSERLVLEYDTLQMSQQLPTAMEGELERQERILMTGIHNDPAEIVTTTFAARQNASAKASFPPFETVLLGNGRLLPGLVDRARSGATVGDVRVHLKGNPPQTGQNPDYARYDLRNAIVDSLQLFPQGATLRTKIGLSYSRVQLSTFVKNQQGAVSSGPGYCFDLAAAASC
jgi:type VI protein secretion system component Hcp